MGNWFIQQKNFKKSQQEQLEKTQKHQKQIELIAEELQPFALQENFKADFTNKKEALEAQKRTFPKAGPSENSERTFPFCQ